MMRTVEVDGVAVRIHENGKPLLLTMRMAAGQMQLWEKLWTPLSEFCSIATFDLPVPDPRTFDDPREIFTLLADRIVDVATKLGHDRFHYFGWAGGSSTGLHVLARHGEHLDSCLLFQPFWPGAETRRLDRVHELIDVLLRQGGLETYTWWWLLNSFTPGYVDEHFDDVQAMVDRRLQADAGRQLDADRVSRWFRALQQPGVESSKLAGVTTPTLLVCTPGEVEGGRRLQRLIPTSELAVVAAPAFAPYESPDTMMAAIRPFLKAAVSGTPRPPSVAGDRLEVRTPDRVVAAVEPRASEAVVFLHGWLMSPEMWRAQLDALDVRCIALAQPGHAGSSAPPEGFTMDNWADATASTIRSLGVERAVVVGHSMGGMLALAIADRHPDLVAGLGLVGTTDETWPEDRRDEMIRAADGCALAWGQDIAAQLARVLLGESFLRRTPAFAGTWANEVARYDLSGIARLARAVASRPDRTQAAIGVPAVVVHGTEDDAVDIDAGRRLAKRLPAAEFIEAPGAGHCPPMETPEIVTDAVRRLVDRVT